MNEFDNCLLTEVKRQIRDWVESLMNLSPADKKRFVRENRPELMKLLQTDDRSVEEVGAGLEKIGMSKTLAPAMKALGPYMRTQMLEDQAERDPDAFNETLNLNRLLKAVS